MAGPSPAETLPYQSEPELEPPCVVEGPSSVALSPRQEAPVVALPPRLEAPVVALPPRLEAPALEPREQRPLLRLLARHEALARWGPTTVREGHYARFYAVWRIPGRGERGVFIAPEPDAWARLSALLPGGEYLGSGSRLRRGADLLDAIHIFTRERGESQRWPSLWEVW